MFSGLLKSGILRWTLRVLVSAVFCVSALAKLLSIDHFELYVYSFGFFSLSVSYVLARLCIAAELALALFTLLGWYPRMMRVLTVLTLLFFSLFLCYTALAGRNDSCQCFGQLVEMNPLQSLVKNGVLILTVLGYYRVESGERRTVSGKWRVWVSGVLLAVCVATPFVVSVPDSWLFGPQEEPYNREALADATAEGGVLASMGVGKGEKLVAFVTPRCPYCKLAREKVGSMARRHHIEDEKIVYVEPSDISDSLFITITYGARPLLMLMDGREVKATYHLRNVDENEVVELLKTNRKK